MNYNVKSIDVFERQAKKLIRKYASLKQELLELVTELKSGPDTGTAIGQIVTKYGYPLHLKVKENQVVPELLPILLFLITLFI